MTGTTLATVDPDKMTSAELHAHFTHLLDGHAFQVTDALEKIDGLEEAFNTKLDAKF
jgi:hypothetical protein